MQFTQQDVVYYSVMWILAFAAGLCRTMRDQDYKRAWDCLFAGGLGGFYAFAVVSILSYYGPSISDFGWGYLGVATAIGALGKEQDKITRSVFVGFLGRILGQDAPGKQKQD